MLLTSCGKHVSETLVSKVYFTQWNQCEALATAVFMLVADDDARDHASLAEATKREAKWRENGYTVISMKNDFKTIYGPEVQKVDFVYPEE